MNRFATALFAALALAAFAPGPAGAGSSERRFLGEAEAGEWRGVGRLNVAGRSFCTATLISEQVALTAAHCLFNPRTRRMAELSSMRFVAGLRLGAHAGVRRVARATLPRGYRYDGVASFDRIGHDLALLELDAPISPARARAFSVGAERPGGRSVSLVSYARDRAHAPSIEEGCRVNGARGAVAALSCDVTYGASGAPVFAEIDGERRIVAIVSALGKDARGAPVTLAVMVEPGIGPLLGALAPGAARQVARAGE